MTVPSSSARVAVSRRRPARSPSTHIRERVVGDGGQERGHGLGQPDDPQLDPVIELQLGVPAQVLDRPRELARVAFGAKRVGQRGVEDDDEALVVARRPCPVAASPGSRPRRAASA